MKSTRPTSTKLDSLHENPAPSGVSSADSAQQSSPRTDALSAESVQSDSILEPTVQPDTHLADSIQPDSILEPTVQPDAHLADSIQPDSSLEPAVQPDAHLADSIQPDSGSADASQHPTSREEERKNKMGHAPVLPLLLSMSLPAMFSMLIQALYNIVDSLYVSRFGLTPQDGEMALRAVTIAFPIQILMIGLAVGTGIGINSLVARRLGEKRYEDADSAAAHSIFLGLLNWLLFVLIGLFLTKPFYRHFTSDPGVYADGTAYLSIVTICSLGVFVQINLEKLLQATGNMIYPMLFHLTGAIINILLDPILIFGWFGLPAMGVRGAAIATVIGQVIALIFSLYIVFAKSHQVHIRLKGFRPRRDIMADIYAVGLPSIIMQSIGSLMIMGINAILVSFTEVAVTVLGIYFRLQSFIFMPVFGLSQGAMPILGYNYGAKNKKRMMETLRYYMMTAIVIMLVGTVIFLVFPRQLLGLFRADAQVTQIGVPALRTIALCFVSAAVGISLSTVFQALGVGKYSLYITVLRQLVLILPLSWFLSRFGLSYLWYAFPLAEIFSFVLGIFLFRKLYESHIAELS